MQMKEVGYPRMTAGISQGEVNLGETVVMSLHSAPWRGVSNVSFREANVLHSFCFQSSSIYQ
jgi:hypothetical protein